MVEDLPFPPTRAKGKLERRDTTWTNRDIPGNQITPWQAGWNVTNAIQGMFIVSLPYAVLNGGYWAILAMVIAAYICYYTGCILIECLYETREETVMRPVINYNNVACEQRSQVAVNYRIRNSYVAISQAVWGKTWGSIVVNGAQLIELLMTCILYVVLCGDLMKGALPYVKLSSVSWMSLCCLCLIPCAFIKTLTGISRFSFACTIVHLLINIIVIVYCVLKIQYWHWRDVKFKIDIWNFPVSMGVIVFSYTSHIFLPALEGNLSHNEDFKPMLKWSHIAAALFKALFGYIGYVTYGLSTQEVITNNLENLKMKMLVNFILVCKALFSYPLPYFAAAELIETSFFNNERFPSCMDLNGLKFKNWAILLRLFLIAITLIMAVMIPYFNNLMGLIGCFTGTLLSFVWPCYFHIKLKGKTLSTKFFYFELSIIIFGMLFGTIGIIYSFIALNTAINS